MEYNPFSDDFRANPYPYYAYLRENDPVHQVTGLGFYVETRYEDVLHVLQEPKTYSSATAMTAMWGDLNPFPPGSPPVIGTDQPVHGRLRSLVNRAFTPATISALESDIRDIVCGLFDEIPPGSQFDLVEEVAIPVPGLVITDLLGLPRSEYRQFKTWADSIIEGTTSQNLDDVAHARIRRHLVAFQDFFRCTIREARAGHGSGLIGKLVEVRDDGTGLSDDEIVSMIVNLMLGGMETTTNLIGNTTIALLDNPAVLRTVQKDPGLVPRVVEESLRYVSPIQGMFRETTEEVWLGDTLLPAGSVLELMFGSANRDETRYPDPDTFNPARSTEGHLAFGRGVHFCIGGPLARMEGAIVMSEMLRRYPALSGSTKGVEYAPSIATRGPLELQISV
jgi:cytochrome P450